MVQLILILHYNRRANISNAIIFIYHVTDVSLNEIQLHQKKSILACINKWEKLRIFEKKKI